MLGLEGRSPRARRAGTGSGVTDVFERLHREGKRVVGRTSSSAVERETRLPPALQGQGFEIARLRKQYMRGSACPGLRPSSGAHTENGTIGSSSCRRRGTARPLRIIDGPAGVDRLAAVLTSETCEKACGKLPSIRPVEGSYSSDSNPRRFETSQAFEDLAQLRRCAHQREVVGQPEGGHQERALRCRQAIDASGGLVAADEAILDQSFWMAATVPTMRGSSGGRNPTGASISRLASSSFDP